MKPSFLIIGLLVLFLLSNCRKNSLVFFNINQEEQVIALQPLDNYNEHESTLISEEISSFFCKKVVVLKPINIPKTFFHAALNAYSADSIIMLLSTLQNDTIREIIGLTHNNIYTIKEFKNRFYNDDAIFGMGYWPGNSCVVSDIRLRTNDTSIVTRRMRNIIIHEIGHNAGLAHCPDNKCIMSKSNGHILTLDTGPGSYCTECKNKLCR